MSEDTKLILDKLDGVENRLGGVESRLDGVESRLDGVENRLGGVESRLEKAEQEGHRTSLLIENELIRGLRIVAENHQELHSRIKSALESKAEKELLLMRTSLLENDVQHIKEKIGIA